MAPYLPTEIWFMVLAYDDPSEHWRHMRPVCRQLRAVVESDFEHRRREKFSNTKINFYNLGIENLRTDPFIEFVFKEYVSDPNGGKTLACFHTKPRVYRKAAVSQVLKKIADNADNIQRYNDTRANMYMCQATVRQNGGCIDPRKLLEDVDHKHYQAPTFYYVVSPEGHSLQYQTIPLPRLQVRMQSLEILVDWQLVYMAMLREQRHGRFQPFKWSMQVSRSIARCEIQKEIKHATTISTLNPRELLDPKARLEWLSSHSR